MKIAVLHGAFKNAGDFLIRERAKKLLLAEYPDAEMVDFLRGEQLDPCIDRINSCDIAIITGGPCYMEDFYPSPAFRFVSDLERIKIPMMVLGAGWYGMRPEDASVYTFHFTPATEKLWRFVERSGASMGCRDWYSYRLLYSHGFLNALMTGCPAWYSLEHIGETRLRQDLLINGRRICISEPAYYSSYTFLPDLFEFLHHRFPDSPLEFISHRGAHSGAADPDSLEACAKLPGLLREKGITFRNIAGSADGFSVYDSCGLHLGFRVHAHIYNLSVRNVSILLKEDGRGTGVDQALGLPTVQTWNTSCPLQTSSTVRTMLSRIKRKLLNQPPLSPWFPSSSNPYFLQSLEDCIALLESTEGLLLENAFQRMRNYFSVMCRHIRQIPRVCERYHKT